MSSPSQPPPPRLHSFIAAPQPQPPANASPSPRYGVRVLSPTKPTRHLSPRKFHQLQQQRREVVLRNMLPLTPLSSAPPPERSPTTTTKAPVPWNPAWLPFPVDAIPVVSAKSVGGAGLSLGTASLDEWLRTFDLEILEYESLEKFAQVKLPEALAFCEKMEQQIAESDAREQQAEAAGDGHPQQPRAGRATRRRRRQARTTSAMARFPVRFRVAVFASLVERAVLAMTQSAGLAHLKPWLLQARQELFRAVFADYDQRCSDEGNGDEGERDGDEDKASGEEETEKSSGEEASESDRDEGGTRGRGQRRRRGPASTAASMATRFGPDAPRPLSFFLSRVPYVLKLQDDSQRRTTRFQRHQVVLRRIVQSLYRSLGSVFHAWKTYTRQRREERLNDKGAQLTAMVVIQRGLVRTIFVEWSKCALKTKLRRAQEREALAKRAHDDRVAELYKEVFLLREQTARLERELALARRGGCAQLAEAGEDDEENDA